MRPNPKRSRIITVVLLLLITPTVAAALGRVAYGATLDHSFAVIAKIAIPVDGNVAVNELLNTIYTSGFNPGAQPIVVINGRTFASMSPGKGSGCRMSIHSTTPIGRQPFTKEVLVVRDGFTNSILTTIPLSDCPINTTYDFAYDRMWAGAQCGGGNDPIYAVNANNFHIIAGPIGSGGVMGDVIANGANGRLYLTSSGVSKRVNPITFKMTTNAFGDVRAINPLTNVLYAASGNKLQIINGAPNPEVIVHTVPLPYTPGEMGINTELNHLYVENPAGCIDEEMVSLAR